MHAGISVRRSRFEFNRFLYPINVVVFEGKEWGHFNAHYLQIALNRKLIYLAKDSVVRDIIKHELAHYFTFILYENVQAHGREYHDVCRQFGFPAEISEATMNLDESNLSKEGDIASEKVVEKVKKLLSLAQSSNTHEAEMATLKANELLLRHNIEYLSDKEEPLYLDRILVRKRKDTKLTAIYHILKHFIVRPVISQGREICCLEVSGSLTNVQLAGYVANFLDRELDVMWEDAKSEYGLSGLQAKNSFYNGVAEGFEQKMKDSIFQYSDSDKKALIVVEKKLDRQTRSIYRRLSTSRSNQETDYEANRAGHAKGLTLSIRNAVSGNGKNLYLPNHKK